MIDQRTKTSFALGCPLAWLAGWFSGNSARRSRVSFISRYDQIYFKLYAAADQGGRHFTDLKKLSPTARGAARGGRWTFTQDISEGFRQIIGEVLQALGYGNLTNQL